MPVPNKKTIINIAGHELKLSNLGKVFYPDSGFNKQQVIDYYIRIAPVLLPHLDGRPLTLKRYPHGVEDKFFYQKECPASKPSWMKTAPVWSESNDKMKNFCIVEDLPSLIWIANLASLELHTSLSRADDLSAPTMIVFDLDPGPPATIINCAQVALWLRNVFDKLKIKSFPKTSGSKGLQLYVPLNTPADYDQTKQFAHQLANWMNDTYPHQVVSNMKKSLRTDKVFIDWSQNDRHKTTVCVYSLRAKEVPTVSTPVTWQEVELCLERKDANVLTFESDEVLSRVEQHGDLFKPVLTLQQYLPR